MTSALAVRAKDDELSRMEKIVCEVATSNGGGSFSKSFRMAAAIRAMHQAITEDMVKELMHLQGSGLGFLTDKDASGGYPAKEVKLVAIEASLMGAYWVGNEFNIIANRPYLTKNFFTRKLAEFPGLTDLQLFPGVPVMSGDKGALVPFVATWRINGKPMRLARVVSKVEGVEIDQRICVKVNSGMGADAILGKAERKIKAAIYARLTGSDFGEDGEDVDIEETHDRPQTSDEPNPTLLETVAAELDEAGSVSNCNAIKAAWLPQCVSVADMAAVNGLCDAKAKAISDSRGERSNK